MKVRLVTSLREFDGLADVWREVTSRAGQESPFLSHDWFACCWRTAGPDRRRELWMLEDAAGPVALIPLLRWKSRYRSLPVRMLSLLQSPDTPFVDIPHTGSARNVVQAFLDALRARSDWDILTLEKLRTGSPILEALEGTLAGQFPWRTVGRDVSPYIATSGTWEELLRSKSPRVRKTCRNIENRLRKAGSITVEEHRHIDPDSPLFTEMMGVSLQSWKGPRGLAMATMQGMPRFFRELTQRASANGWLHLWVLRMDGRPIATEYQIGSNGSIHALRADFDGTLSDLSPGTALSLRIMPALFARREIHEYDMGPGANPYKLRWATGVHESVTLEAYAPTAYGRFLHAVETRLIPLVRTWRARVRRRCA